MATFFEEAQRRQQREQAARSMLDFNGAPTERSDRQAVIEATAPMVSSNRAREGMAARMAQFNAAAPYGGNDWPKLAPGGTSFVQPQNAVLDVPNQPPAASAQDAAPVAPAATASSASLENTQGTSKMALNAAAPTGGVPSATTSNNVIRDGNSYSGANISGDITINGRAPGGGSISTQNMAAADALGARPFMSQPSMAQAAGIQAPMVRSSLNDWQMRNELRNAEVSANSITNNGGRFDRHGRGVVSPAMLQYQSLLKSDQALRSGQPTADIAAMREGAGLQREGMQQAGANQRSMWQTAVDQRRLKMDETTRGFTDRAAQQQEQLRSVLLDPKATPEQRQQAQQALLAISGKQHDLKDNFVVAGGGQEWSDRANAMRNVPQRVIDLRTGQEIGGAQGRFQPMPASADQAVKWQVYQTPRGPAVWDGQQFQPLR